jgi:exonuclease III
MATLNSSCFTCNVVSYNLHGLNSGRSLLYELCNDPNNYIIGVQEHWLTPNNLHVLNNVHPDFCAYGISAMANRLSSGIYLGRPYGGVAFLWRKSINDRIQVASAGVDGRSLCITLRLNDTTLVKLIVVYFPCGRGGPD